MTDKEIIALWKRCEERETCEGCSDWKRKGSCDVDRYCGTDTLIPRLEALLAENEHLREGKMVPRWHPVSEAPKEYRDEDGELKCFLVCLENCTAPYRAFYDGKSWGDGWNVLDVIYWMPLPELPSTEGVE